MNENHNFTFQRAVPADLDDIVALCSRVSAHLPGCGWNKDYPNREILTADIAGGGLYKVLADGRWLAIAQIRPWAEFMAEEDSDGSVAWDDTAKNPCAGGRFCVAPEVQGTGLGRPLLAAGLQFIRDLGYDSLRFYAVDFNHIAVHLYDSIGFPRVGELDAHGLHFICYEKRL